MDELPHFGSCMTYRGWAILMSAAVLAGCTPTASRHIPLSPSTDAGRLAACAERVVAQLARQDNRWEARVTHRDRAAGGLETGDFKSWNATGFRIRVVPDLHRREAALHLKGAGAYFTDLGVDAAADRFVAAFRQCLPAP